MTSPVQTSLTSRFLTRSATRRAVLAAPLVAGVALLGACGGSSTTATATPSSSVSSASSSASASADASASAAASPSGVAAATGPVKQTKVGVSVTGALGQKPALTVPATSAPTTLSAEVLTQGNGPVITKGQTLVANYLGETWTAKDGKPNIFDNSYDRLHPAGFAIGAGQVITGWDDTLVGQKAGTRLLLTIPPDKAYGASPSPGNELAGQTLLFVVDVLAGLDKNASSTGADVKAPAGFPAVTSTSGVKPEITSVAGVKPGTGADSQSTLLIQGTGDVIDPKKALAMQIVQTDTATGKQTQATWGQALQVIPAENVLAIAKALSGAKIGSRALVVTPDSTSRPSVVLVLDVVGQY